MTSDLKIRVCIKIAKGKILFSSLALSRSFSYEIEGDDLLLQEQLSAWLNAYLKKRPQKTSFLPVLGVSFSPFQQKILAKLEEIPFGEKKSYKELAESIGSRGFRAAGSACGKNPLPLFIPCHRVVTSEGKVGGFTCGPDVKRELLRFEGSLI